MIQRIKSIGKSISKNFNENWQFHVLCLPVFIKLLIFSYIPMVGIIIAFKYYNYADGIFGSPWAGFDNFEFFFKSVDAWRVTRNTVAYSVGFILLGTSFSAFFALLMFEIRSRRSIKIFQTSYLIPHFLSWVVVSFAFDAVFRMNGAFNNLLSFLGADRINFYHNPVYWPVLLPLAHLWNALGFAILILYAILLGIDTSYYEAAEIDGASKLQKAWHISIPFLKPMIIIQLILGMGKIFDSEFGLFYFIPRAMHNTVLFPTVDVIDTFVFRALMKMGDFGMSSAAGFYKSVVGFFMLIATNYIVKKIDKESSLF